ncbi:MAG: hypothetical protein M4579_007427, partial [Chaenotheca gracillima]
KTGLEHTFTQYVIRRANCNVVNDNAPASVRDQIMDHYSNAVQYYVDREVRCDTQAAYLGRPSDETVQKLARLMSLTVDPNAPTKLSDEQSRELAKHPKILRLGNKSKELTAQCKARYGTVVQAAGTDLYKQKKEADAALNRARFKRRSKVLRRARKKHFRNAGTRALNSQFCSSTFDHHDGAARARPDKYEVNERGLVIQLTCDPSDHLTAEEKLLQRVRAIEVRAALCNRQERPRRGKPTTRPNTDTIKEGSKEEELYPLICKPTQCIICIGDKSKSFENRTFAYCNINKMREHVERSHLRYLLPKKEVTCYHPLCQSPKVVLHGIILQP